MFLALSVALGEDCKDVNTNCEDRKDLCLYPGFRQHYEKVCAKTCGFCKAKDEVEVEMVDDAECKDQDKAYCQKRKDRCKLGWMKKMMKKKCPETCGYCGDGGCQDRSKKCAARAGLCKSPDWKDYLKKMCPKTCGYCRKPYTTLPPGVTNPPYTGKCGVPEVKGVRVVSGTTPPRGAWPWQVLMLWDDRSPFCGGTLIAPQWVVSAAHCVYGNIEEEPTRLYVRVGGHDWRHIMGSEKDIKVAKILRHAKYDAMSMNNDMALIKLSKPVMFNKYVQPACLPSQNPPVGAKCYITGYGHTSAKGKMNPVIQQGLLPVVANEVCYEKNKHIMERVIRDGMICGGSGGTSPISGCQGDSGGPYVCHINGKWELHGAVSYGSPFCKSSDMYTVFARIYYYLDWLKEKMAKH